MQSADEARQIVEEFEHRPLVLHDAPLYVHYTPELIPRSLLRLGGAVLQVVDFPGDWRAFHEHFRDFARDIRHYRIGISIFARCQRVLMIFVCFIVPLEDGMQKGWVTFHSPQAATRALLEIRCRAPPEYGPRLNIRYSSINQARLVGDGFSTGKESYRLVQDHEDVRNHSDDGSILKIDRSRAVFRRSWGDTFHTLRRYNPREPVLD